MLSQAGQQQGSRLSSQHLRAAPDTGSAAPLPQPAGQAGWKEKLPEGWAPSHGWLPMGYGEQKVARSGGQRSPWWARGFGTSRPGIQACLLPPLTPTSSDGVALLLCSLSGLRPLVDAHLTPVELLVHCFEA